MKHELQMMVMLDLKKLNKMQRMTCCKNIKRQLMRINH